MGLKVRRGNIFFKKTLDFSSILIKTKKIKKGQTRGSGF
jgi:hypothetical protein